MSLLFITRTMTDGYPLRFTSSSSSSLLQIILHSMHKYQPRVHVIRKDFSSELSQNKAVPSGDGVKTFSFPETVFTTVTAYQNQQVPSLFPPFSRSSRIKANNKRSLCGFHSKRGISTQYLRHCLPGLVPFLLYHYSTD